MVEILKFRENFGQINRKTKKQVSYVTFTANLRKLNSKCDKNGVVVIKQVRKRKVIEKEALERHVPSFEPVLFRTSRRSAISELRHLHVDNMKWSGGETRTGIPSFASGGVCNAVHVALRRFVRLFVLLASAAGFRVGHSLRLVLLERTVTSFAHKTFVLFLD